jgi:hypothetical protein
MHGDKLACEMYLIFYEPLEGELKLAHFHCFVFFVCCCVDCFRC